MVPAKSLVPAPLPEYLSSALQAAGWFTLVSLVSSPSETMSWFHSFPHVRVLLTAAFFFAARLASKSSSSSSSCPPPPSEDDVTPPPSPTASPSPPPSPTARLSPTPTVSKEELEETIEHHKALAKKRLSHSDLTAMEINPSGEHFDKVFTIGCFDLFHYGHELLLQRLATLGKEVIVGVHSSESIKLLKNKYPVDSTEQRMLNVKKAGASSVFCVHGTDPSDFIRCAMTRKNGETAVYVRGADMINFPGRQVVEDAGIQVRFLPYTEGVSASALRKTLIDQGKIVV